MPSLSRARQKRWERWAFAWSQRRADRVICQSKAMAGDVVRTSRVNPENILVVYNPVTPAQDHVVTGMHQSDAPHFLAVGRLAPEKRLHLVIRAFAILKREHPSSATLTILGDGPCRQSLEDLSDSEGVADSVRFVGYQQNTTSWMRDSHALVMASEFEGLPNVVLEAISGRASCRGDRLPGRHPRDCRGGAQHHANPGRNPRRPCPSHGGDHRIIDAARPSRDRILGTIQSPVRDSTVRTNPEPIMVRILMIGPLSGPRGGATILFRQLVTELQAQPDVAVNVLDTSHGRSRISGLWRLLSITVRTIALITKSDVISLHISSMRAALYAAFLWILCAATGRPWVLRIFGDASVKHSKIPSAERELMDWILRRCPLLLVETRIAEQYFRPRCRRVEWYPNSRPLVGAAPRKERSETSRFVFIGHVKPSKGVRDIFTAVHNLGNAVTVDVYGPLCDGIEPSEFTSAVRYRGELSREQVVTVISTYDVLLLPTYYSGEGYPGVILEAFAAGLPVIATRWQAIPEIVTNENGVLVEPHDTFHLAAAMRYLVQSPAEFRRLREGASQTARRLDSVLWTDRFVQLTLDLVAQRQREQLLAPSSVKPN